MAVKIQIFCFLISFAYGFLLCLSDKINNKLLGKKILVTKLIGYLLYAFITTIVYIIIIYKVNGGIFHPYFGFFLILGYYLSNRWQIFVKLKENNCK